MRRFFLDTEFTDLTQQAELISMALVAETGEWLYIEIDDVDLNKSSEFVKQNILPQLNALSENANRNQQTIKCHKKDAELHLNQWFGQFEEFHSHTPTIQIWADCYAWDWMLFCDIFKHALNLPKAIHYMPMDLATWLQSLGINPDAQRDSIVEYTVPVSGLHQHHALYDALLERACFLKYNHEARIPI